MSKDHFDLIARFYDWAAQFTPSGTLLGLLSLPSAGFLLDAGGGTGRVAAALRDSVREAIVVDLSRGMLDQAVGKGLVVTHAPLECLPFPSESFDRIIMMDAFHHVLDQRATGRELWRVLALEGRIVIVEPDIQNLFVKMIAIGEKLLLMRSHFLSGNRISDLFSQRGARVSVVHDKWNVVVLVEKVRQL